MDKTLKGMIAVLGLLVLVVVAPAVEANQTYTGCIGCHGDFRAAPYSSLASAKAGSASWPGGLHDVHRNGAAATTPGMLNGNCNACHSGPSRTPVLIGVSDATAPFNLSCAGCHDGPGVREHHRNTGASTCSCHTGDPTPAAENVLRPVYTAPFGTTSGTTRVKDPCNTGASFEGRLADVTTLGLDNDGNLSYDAADAACVQPNRTPTVGAVTPSTLTSAAGVAQTFRAVYGDADGYTNLKFAEFLVSPTGGRANAILVRYFRQSNRIRLYNDAGTALLAGSCAPGAVAVLQNSQGRVICRGSLATGAGTSLVLRLRIIPKAAFAGPTPKQLRTRAIDDANATSGLRLRGTWTIQ